MNLSKHLELFNPRHVDASIHIIGCGAVGSTIAEMLTRLGCTDIHLYDFDIVTAHNIANQMFLNTHIADTKIIAVRHILKQINPDIEVTVYPEGYVKQRLSGYVFLCVDNIDLRRNITEQQLQNPHIKAMFDFRLELHVGQFYLADWKNQKHKEDFINSMQFTHEEAAQETPTNACGLSLGLLPTNRVICSFGVAQFINHVNEQPYKKLIVANAFTGLVDAF